ncbi:MAG: phosphoglycerate kinase [Acidobacteria bacterium]|nr:phosphoglycerate kinase [Acidobacteriota bacterium]
MNFRRLSVRDLDVRGKRVFVRVDFNVPLRGGSVADDTRLKASLPTLQLLAERKARIVAASHLGRPHGKRVPNMSLAPVIDPLSTLLSRPVRMAPDCVGPEVEGEVRDLAEGEILLLENLRFHKEEEANDSDFASQLAGLADLFVNDAFGSSHRAHASVVGIPRHLSGSAVGLLLEREMEMLSRLREHHESPYIAVLGGAKVSDKMDLLHNLIGKVDAILIGGAMAYTFLKAKGMTVGSSRIEQGKIEHAKVILARAQETGVALHLPQDHVVARSPEPGAACHATRGVSIERGMIAFDIGPKTRELYRKEIASARTIFWNGPLGMFEVPPYDEGTRAVADGIDSSRSFSVIGGGDSAAAMIALDLAGRFTHVSTGGGASLEFLAGVDLPGILALSRAPGGAA